MIDSDCFPLSDHEFVPETSPKIGKIVGRFVIKSVYARDAQDAVDVQEPSFSKLPNSCSGDEHVKMRKDVRFSSEFEGFIPYDC